MLMFTKCQNVGVFTVEKKIPEVHPRELTPKWVSERAEPLILTYSRKGVSR